MEQDPGRQLSEARRQMVMQRRLMIRSLGTGHDRDQMEAHINLMVKVQSAIDVIDRVARKSARCTIMKPILPEAVESGGHPVEKK